MFFKENKAFGTTSPQENFNYLVRAVIDWKPIISLLVKYPDSFPDIFSYYNIPDTPDHRYKIVFSYISIFCANNAPYLLEKNNNSDISQKESDGFYRHTSKQIGTDMHILFGGDRRMAIFAQGGEGGSTRHMRRTGEIMRALFKEIKKSGQGWKNQVATETISEVDEKLMFIVGFFHDAGRWISQGLDHDAWAEKMWDEIGLRKEISQSFHLPVNEPGFKGDSKIQMISRISDLVAKINNDEFFKPPAHYVLRATSIEELLNYSKKVQMSYLNKRVASDSPHFESEKKIVEQYLQDEREAVLAIQHWFQSMEIDIDEVLEKISKDISSQDNRMGVSSEGSFPASPFYR